MLAEEGQKNGGVAVAQFSNSYLGWPDNESFRRLTIAVPPHLPPLEFWPFYEIDRKNPAVTSVLAAMVFEPL